MNREVAPTDEIFVEPGAPVKMPLGRYAFITWNIPREFGGLTNVLLHRANAFSQFGGVPVDIVTLGAEMDTARVRERLRKQGHKLSSRVRLLNLWEELRGMDDTALAHFAGSSDEEIVPEAGAMADTDAAARAKRVDAQGETLQIDYRRPDGSLWAIDRRDAVKRGRLGGRRITLFDSRSEPVAQWTSPSGLYFAWLDWIFRDQRAYVICDSQFVGSFIHRYRRNNVTIAQVLHNSHLRATSDGPRGQLTRGKSAIIAHADAYDLFAALTDSQAQDLRDADLVGDAMRVIPNSREIAPAILDEEKRPPGRGVVLARLTSQKRVDDAIHAIVQARREDPRISLKIFGDGVDRPKLQGIIDDFAAGEYVSLEGHTPDAVREFARANFSVLSSKFEGFGLVLVESMAAGCIPIAYDIRYGPSDIIADGVNGFLVPAGDRNALARTVQHVASMGADALRTMRRAAVERAKDFSDERIVSLWGEELERARLRSLPRRPQISSPQLTGVSYMDDGVLRLSGRFGLRHSGSADFRLSLFKRNDPTWYQRAPINIVSHTDGTVRFESDIRIAGLLAPSSGIWDVSVDGIGGGYIERVRVRARMDMDVRAEGLRVYSTVHGNLSIAVERS